MFCALFFWYIIVLTVKWTLLVFVLCCHAHNTFSRREFGTSVTAMESRTPLSFPDGEDQHAFPFESSTNASNSSQTITQNVKLPHSFATDCVRDALHQDAGLGGRLSTSVQHHRPRQLQLHQAATFAHGAVETREWRRQRNAHGARGK